MNGEQIRTGKEGVFCVRVYTHTHTHTLYRQSHETLKKSTKSSIITGDLIFEKRTLNLPKVSTSAQNIGDFSSVITI